VGLVHAPYQGTVLGLYTISMPPRRQRCPWAESDPLLRDYHDVEWGVPVRDSRELWAKLVLDGQQAGLSWLTILRKRDGYLSAFDGFDPARIARYGEADTARLLADPGIVRNRQKVRSVIVNANAYLEHFGAPQAFSDFVWSFTGGKTVNNRWHGDGDIPALSPESEALSKALRQRGFSFVGPTIVYAFMQAVGLVNDHLVSCPRHAEVQKL
jgi:DNA-3-methyladenine glycosylase I